MSASFREHIVKIMEITQTEKAADILQTSRKTIALTGAGVSTESGIPDFRSAGGLWSRYDPYEYGTIHAFKRDPEKVWQMLAELMKIADAKPNAGHRVMARLEEKGLLKGVITQNIDMLHQKAGSHNVVEFHGAVKTLTCLSCGKQYPNTFVTPENMPPRCMDCESIIKPDVVFFDEQIPNDSLFGAEELMADADVILVAGTSCQVAPASYIPQRLYEQGGRIIELNLEPALEAIASVTLAGGFSEQMEKLERQLH